jgi:putative phosphonate metabolism protein
MPCGRGVAVVSRRYALYWAPSQDSALWRAGCHILGRDVATGEELPQPRLPGLLPQRFRELTASPRVYGLHATLKPPFRLAPDASEKELRGSLDSFVSKRCPFRLPGMALATIGRFLALTPPAPSNELDLLARDCVEGFDHFRAPPAPSEVEKRRAGGLSSRQDALLTRWGYPYVMEEYRFHLTLTGSIQDALERQVCRQGLARLLDGAVQEELASVEAMEICLFEQPGQGQPFYLTARYPFGGSR